MLSNMATHFGKALSDLMGRSGMSAYKLALDAELSRSYVGRLISGERPPTDEAIEKIAPVLGVPVEDLKKAALRDTMNDQEIAAAAEIADENATLKETVDRWVKVHFRKKDLPPKDQEAFLKELAELIQVADEHWDEL
jgi:transcriptional regulator with XRE-family HTH domain